jgi:hypothetical protein
MLENKFEYFKLNFFRIQSIAFNDILHKTDLGYMFKIQ